MCICVSYSRRAVRGAALADQQLDYIKVVVMDGHVQRGQAILKEERGDTWPQSATADCHLILADEYWDIRCLSWWITFPAALGLAPLSKSSSATSTFPYLHATCRGVNPFCKKTQIFSLRMQMKMWIFSFYLCKWPFVNDPPTSVTVANSHRPCEGRIFWRSQLYKTHKTPMDGSRC